jgi:hypothetical protein
MKTPSCYCSRCKTKTPHWYDGMFYAFFCTICDVDPRNPARNPVAKLPPVQAQP